jgi:general secretion pathway protein D
VISRSTGLNFMFDKDVRADLRATINIRDANVEELIRYILVTNQLDQKLVNETTLLIYPNTPQKQREYQELVIKSFYLANADVKQTANMIRTLVKTRDIFIDEKLNMVVIRDTPNAVRMAEKLILAQDLADPEVMLEVEVLEVSNTRLLALGLQYPSTLAVSLAGGGTSSTNILPSGTAVTSTGTGTPGQFSLTQWLGSPRSQLVQLAVSNPFFAVNLQQTNGATNVLANPRIRVKNKEKAKIHIGDRVPVFTTTAAATGGFVSSSVTYLKEVPSKDGNTLAYQIGTRNTTTVLRLRDGETQILAGLISDEDRRSATGIPGLTSLPVVGRLFSNTNTTHGKTEVMLLITPRLLRTLARPDARLIEFSAGTEASTGAAPGIFTPPVPVPQPIAPKPEAIPAPIIPPGGQGAPQPLTPQVPTGPALVPFGGLQAPKP